MCKNIKLVVEDLLGVVRLAYIMDYFSETGTDWITGIMSRKIFKKVVALRASYTRILVALNSFPPAHLKSNFQNFC